MYRPPNWPRTAIGLGIFLTLVAEGLVSSLVKGDTGGKPALVAAPLQAWEGVPAITRALVSATLLLILIAFLVVRRWRPASPHPIDDTNKEAP